MRRSQARLGAIALVVAACPFAFASLARAKMMEEDDETGVVAPSPSTSPSSFAGLFGLAAVQRASKSPDAKTRAAAVQRAAEMGGDDAWKVVEASASDGLGDEYDGPLLVRLAAARALASDPRRTSATAALRALLNSPLPALHAAGPFPSMMGPMGPPWTPPIPQPPPLIGRKPADAELLRLVRATAALALAAQGDFDTLLSRARARDDAEAQSAALGALIAFPPPSLGNVLGKAEGTIGRDTVELLAALGDLRAADVLLRVANGKDDLAAAAAMHALAIMSDGRVVAVARDVKPDEEVHVRIAAAEALALLGDSGAPAAIQALVSNKKTELDGRRLALAFPSKELLPAIEARAKAADPAAIAALARLGASGIPALAKLAKDDASPAADAAAFALAESPSSGAADALASILDGASESGRRRAVRAGAVRAARLGDVPSAVRDAAKSLLGSKVDADRWAGATLRAVRDLGDAKDLLASDDVVLRRAAAVALAAHDLDAAASVARKHLAAASSTEDAIVVRALATVAARAVDGSAEHDVPITTSTLAVWLAEDGDASALAAFLLASRGGEAVAAHVARALASDDLSVRASTLLGLAASPDASASGEIAARWSELRLAEVRRAAVRALAARGDPSGAKVLALARRLDPDDDARALAGSAILLPGVKHRSPLLVGGEVVESALHTVVVGGAKSAIVATYMRPDGLAVPAFADPDGVVLLFGAPVGLGRLDVRPAATKTSAP
jgi:hypothetical protein